MDHQKEQAQRVLLLSDDRLSLRVLASVLGDHGLEIVGDAMTEHAALELMAERAPDVAILDLHGTDGSGRAARAIFNSVLKPGSS